MSPINHIRRFRTSFRSKLLLIFTVFTGIISAAFVLVLISGEIRNYNERSSEKAQLLASLMAVRITLPLYSENVVELRRIATELLSTPHVAQIVITNSDNRKLVDISQISDKAIEPLITASAPVISAAASPSVEAAFSGVANNSSSPLGAVSVSINPNGRIVAIRTAIFKIGGIALFFWLSVVLSCYPVLKRVTRSFNSITEGVDSMMEGSFTTKIIIDKDDEAGRAAQAVNRLAAALDEREAENRTLQDKLFKAMRHEVQEERRTVIAKLIQTNRMTSLGLLISSIAHNINTPNGAIKLAAQHVSGAWKDALPILEQVTKEEGDFVLGGMPFSSAKGEIKGANESILKNANRVERVIQDLRTYNLGERNELSPGVDVNRVVEEALTIIRANGRQGEISITPVLATNLPHVTVSKKIHQCFSRS